METYKLAIVVLGYLNLPLLVFFMNKCSAFRFVVNSIRIFVIFPRNDYMIKENQKLKFVMCGKESNLNSNNLIHTNSKISVNEYI